MTTEELEQIRERATSLRCKIVESTCRAGSGHPGGSLSCADIVALLYFHILQLDPENPGWTERDRFILTKGHAAPLLYAALAEKGFFPSDELQHLRELGHMLQGHPDCRRTPGVEASTGSLGQGLSIALGISLAGKLDEAEWGVYALLGDGELQEGQVWEAAMAASHYGADNLIAIVDYNDLQIDGHLCDVMSVEPLADKWRAFGWAVWTVDGHDLFALDEALREAQLASCPAMIIARTVKGKGVSFMEGEASWHGKAPSAEQAEQALCELRGGGADE